jgi:hypothetical protein
MTQYRHDYPPKLSDKSGANMDNVSLRKTHFILGDDKNSYQTSAMVQSDGIEKIGKCNPSLDEKAKNDLRRSHFIFGNFDPNYNTTFRREYYDKSNLVPKGNLDFKNNERKFRNQNYQLGTDQPDYISETAAKYTKPNLDANKNGPNRVSTAMLQQSHYVFGNSNIPWNTTHRRAFTPKRAETHIIKKNLTKTNFVLGDDEPTIKSVNEEIYVKHPLQKNPMDKKLLNDLRTHHFDFGRDEVPNQHVTQNQITYKNPNIDPRQGPKVSNKGLRETHWTMGDKAQELPDMYKTSYDRAHTPKKSDGKPDINKTTLKSSFSINGKMPMVYQTDYRANYIPMNSQMDPNAKKELDDITKNIKKSHFNLGEMKNDYNTVMDSSYKFDPNAAKYAKGVLDKKLLNDLRSTHYKLGQDIVVNQTTQRRDYLPYKLDPNQNKKKGFRESNIKLADVNNIKFEGQTIYMTDYIPKQIPKDENECWC